MRRHKGAITREKYLALGYGSDLPEPWPPEHEAELPAELQHLADAGFDPDEPRDPQGKWTEGGSGGPGQAGQEAGAAAGQAAAGAVAARRPGGGGGDGGVAEAKESARTG